MSQPAPGVDRGLPVLVAMSPSQPQTVYAVAAGQTDDGQRVFRSDDGGVTWVPRARLDSANLLAALVVHPQHTEILYGGGTGLFRSGDSGTSWQALDTEIEVRALAVLAGDPTLIYAVTAEGALRSNDEGRSWTLLCPAGLVNGPAEFLDIVTMTGTKQVLLLARPTRPDISTPSSGVCWDTTVPRYDLGQGWQQYQEGLPVFFEEHRP
jgi:hypothetical protein